MAGLSLPLLSLFRFGCMSAAETHDETRRTAISVGNGRRPAARALVNRAAQRLRRPASIPDA